MINPSHPGPVQSARRPSVALPLIVGTGAFAIGAALTFGYIQWKSQQQQLELMAQMVQNLQQPAPVAAQQPASVREPTPQFFEQDVTTRNAPVDLLSVAPVDLLIPAQPAVAPAAPTPTPAPADVVAVSAPAAAAAAPAADDNAPKSTADKIRALVARSNDPLVSAVLAQDAARRETMSVAIQGVNELVEAALAGNYTLSAIEGGGGVRMTFPGREEDQAQLERLLSSAADAGMIAFNASVKGSDGSFDGKIILFDLIERALVHGTPEERHTGAQIKEDALALLGTSNSAIAEAAPANASGQRVYKVEAGDSLAYIALQFYGNTNAYLRIFEANRDKLSSPEKIQIGQELIIPSA